MNTNEELVKEMRCLDCNSIGDFLIGLFGKVQCGGCGRIFVKKMAQAIKYEAHDVLYGLELESERACHPVHDQHDTPTLLLREHEIAMDDRGYHLENGMVDYINADLTDIYETTGEVILCGSISQ